MEYSHSPVPIPGGELSSYMYSAVMTEPPELGDLKGYLTERPHKPWLHMFNMQELKPI